MAFLFFWQRLHTFAHLLHTLQKSHELFASLAQRVFRCTKIKLVGARPLHLAYARPFCRLKAPLGLSLLHFAAQTRTCRGEAPPSCLRKTVLSLKSPTGAFIAPLRCANANNAFLLCTKSYIVWRKIGVWCSFYWKFIKRKNPKPLVPSRSFGLCFA